MKIDIRDYIVLNSERGVDMEKTLAKFEEDVVIFYDTEVKSADVIKGHVMAIFEAFPGVNTNVGYVVNECHRRMESNAKNFAILDAKIKGFLKASVDCGALVTTKGAKGGVKLGDLSKF
jgi:hypothetical protein